MVDYVKVVQILKNSFVHFRGKCNLQLQIYSEQNANGKVLFLIEGMALNGDMDLQEIIYSFLNEIRVTDSIYMASKA
jgi:hypothetical protein